ncbi:MAG: peptide deformylase [Chloroflexi bacterium]|nr:peptide deformylase [Chloroflexota bacterium]
MAVLTIRQVGDPVLREKCKRISKIDPSLQRLIDDMFETTHEAGGVGLAAPQVGVPLRLFVVQLPDDYEDPLAGEPIVLINPEIVKMSGEHTPEEGCLSYPGWVANVRRAYHVTIKGRDRHGREVRYRSEGFLAQAFQHELDHLNGVLFFDHLASLDELRRPAPRESEEVSVRA